MLATRILSAAALLFAFAACGGAGMGKNVRKDITAQISTIEAPVAACYEAALKRDRKLRGTIVVAFDAEPKTGAFKNVRVTRSGLPDEALETCVMDEVSKLKLSKPQKTVVSVNYPLRFSPTN